MKPKGNNVHVHVHNKFGTQTTRFLIWFALVEVIRPFALLMFCGAKHGHCFFVFTTIPGCKQVYAIRIRAYYVHRHLSVPILSTNVFEAQMGICPF
jgi:hypothetical protein